MADLDLNLRAEDALDPAGFDLDFVSGERDLNLRATGAMAPAGLNMGLTSHADFDFNLVVIGGGADMIEPLITNIQPSTATPITRTQPVSFDVTDETVLHTIVIMASFNGGQQVEVVYDGDTFRGNYRGASNSIAVIDDGYHFTILRDGGWESSPTIEYLVKDKFNVAVTA